MRFTDTHPDQNYSLHRMRSETGRWELGLRPMLFGVRFSAGLSGDGGVSVDYCAGASLLTQTLLLWMLRLIMEGQPEGIQPHELRAMLPTYTVRPIDRDEVCWNRLIELAAQAQERTNAEN